jgi:hypothetical protein
MNMYLICDKIACPSTFSILPELTVHPLGIASSVSHTVTNIGSIVYRPRQQEGEPGVVTHQNTTLSKPSDPRTPLNTM